MKFTLNEHGVEEVIKSNDVSRFLEHAAGQVADAVENQAERFQQTRHFAGSIESHHPEATARGQRVTVDSSDFAAHIIEFGSSNNPPYAPFRKAASALGLRLRGGGERR